LVRPLSLPRRRFRPIRRLTRRDPAYQRPYQSCRPSVRVWTCRVPVPLLRRVFDIAVGKRRRSSEGSMSRLYACKLQPKRAFVERKPGELARPTVPRRSSGGRLRTAPPLTKWSSDGPLGRPEGGEGPSDAQLSQYANCRGFFMRLNGVEPSRVFPPTRPSKKWFEGV
jgi:hypothetical protein